MSKPILQLQNSSNWQGIWTYSATAEPVAERPGYTRPIPPIVVPFLLENHIVAIAASSPTAKATWQLAGKVAKKISTGLTFGGVPDTTVSDARRLYLNRINLFRFEPLTDTYALVIAPVYYLKDIDLAMWIYTGIDTDTTTNSLARIEAAIATSLS